MQLFVYMLFAFYTMLYIVYPRANGTDDLSIATAFNSWHDALLAMTKQAEAAARVASFADSEVNAASSAVQHNIQHTSSEEELSLEEEPLVCRRGTETGRESM